MKHVVLVTDGEQRAALAIVRSLGRAGHEIHVCSVRGRTIAGASRYCRREWRVPDALVASDAFVSAVADCAQRIGATVILPIAEPALLALLPQRSRFSGATLPFADAESFAAICDKNLVLTRAADVGIAVPEQVVLRDGDASAVTRYPVALKPSRSIGERNGVRVKLGVRYADTAAECREKLAAFDSAAFPVLAQQRVVGPGIGIFLLIWDGRVVASFAHRRLREKPPSGGVSVYRESVAADPELLAQSEQLLATFQWRGVAMIEYKVDARTGTPYLMEINGRFWGSLQLAIDAGVDFPSLLVDVATGADVTAEAPYTEGVRSRWWWGDIDQLLLRVRHPAAALDLPPGSPGRLHALGKFLVLWQPGDHNEILRLSDPKPFVRETIDWFLRR